MPLRASTVAAALWLAIVGHEAHARPHQQDDAPAIELRKGDHVSLVGNTLAERMQHAGWLETLLQARFPDRELVIRNLGYSGDELTLRLRSEGFGSPDDHLRRTETDVVLAFFGANEAHAGPAGLPKFKTDLAEYLRHLRGQKFNEDSTPRVVLFSPIAHEDLRDPHLPDGAAHNAHLALYTAAMAEVAKAEGVPFVDLFATTRDLYAATAQPLTSNGIHLENQGDELVAQAIDRALFGSKGGAADRDADTLAKIRAAVLDKNFHWYNRHRTTDGYSTYGGRADLRFVDGQTNRVVMDREMAILDAMTATRDRRIWAIARGEDPGPPDDSTTPPFIPVITNKPGTGPNGEHIYLGGEESIARMTVAKGLKVELVASEEQFPELINPVQMAFDPKGRLFVATWPGYPHWKPKTAMDDRLLILHDDDGDGRTDRATTFAGGLHNTTGFEFYGGGVIVANAPDLLFLKDTDGDDVADVRERLLSGLDTADTHHGSNSFAFDPGGALYFQEGTFHHTQVETPWGPPVRLANAGVFRFEPRTKKFGVYVAYNFANPHGHVFDRWGQDVVHDGTGANPYHGTLFSGRVVFPNKHPQPPQVYQQRTRPCPGTEILSSRHFPADMQGDLLVGNVIGFQGILRYKLADQGASLSGTEAEPILSSDDPNFRPSDFEIGPDGALYFTDWQNPVIGHMQHNLRDPSRDKIHGRVYRVVAEGRPLLKPAKIASQPIPALLDLLKGPEDRVRLRAKIELSARDASEVVAAAGRWVEGLDANDHDYQHHLMEGLWVHQWHDSVNEPLLKRMLKSPDANARASAVRVLCDWRDRVPGALDLLLAAAADPSPMVRLEAVRAASYFDEPEAIDVAAVVGEQPTDPYIDYTRNETLKTLEPAWKAVVAAGKPLPVKTDAGARLVLRAMTLDQLAAQPRTRPVARELLARPGVRDELRLAALGDLARLDGKPDLDTLIEAIRAADAAEATRDDSVATDLVRLLGGFGAARLGPARGALTELATAAKRPIIRQASLAALVGLDGSADRAWELATASPSALRDFLGAVPLIADPGVRAGLFSKIEPLLRGLPEGLSAGKGMGVPARYIRIELPRPGTLTLAEVRVIADGRNVAPSGRATQKNTAHGGEAPRAIDGNAAGDYGSGGQTHTEENTDRPWWELDLGEEVAIESIAVANRTDGYLGNRLKGYTLTLLDSDRREVFRRDDQPAPAPESTFALGAGSTGGSIRRAAIDALASLRGREADAFAALAPLVVVGDDRLAAVRAIQRLPRANWPADRAPAMLGALLDSIRGLPIAERTSPAALDQIQLAESLAALLPADDARRYRAELRELGVRVIRLGTLPERMSYDQEVIAVEAGRPVEIVFENIDLMPHNFVVTQPGALEEVGLQGEEFALKPGAAERGYVPPNDKILLSSRLLQTREAQRLTFSAPSQSGVYPYVCTYPGHWRRMYGSLYVVDDLEAYLADPSAYLAAHPMAPVDPLLKDRRPRTEWTYDDLAGSVAELAPGRSFASGQQLFTTATCVSCHKVDGQGNEFGPDLTKLDAKKGPAEILRSLIEPSAEVEEKYRAQVFELENGQVVGGLVVGETPEAIKLVENPLASAEPRLVPKNQIAARQASTTSIMPKGLLDKLSRDEILDLIAYLVARGDAGHPLVSPDARGAHAGHGH